MVFVVRGFVLLVAKVTWVVLYQMLGVSLLLILSIMLNKIRFSFAFFIGYRNYLHLVKYLIAHDLH